MTRARPTIVHGLWIGRYLTRLHRLTIRSFLAHRHPFHLWCYERPSVELPGVVLRDADEIIPRARIFRKRRHDPESGVGAGSLAPFSDIFRAKLLYEHGGIYTDLDVTCLRPFPEDEPYVFRFHKIGVPGNLVKVPRRSPLMRDLHAHLAAHLHDDAPWHTITRSFGDLIKRHGLEAYIRPELTPPDRWDALRPFVISDAEPDPRWCAIHWMYELWRTLRASGGLYKGERFADPIPDPEHPERGTTLARLYEQHGLLAVDRPPTRAPSLAPRASASVQPIRPSVHASLHVNLLVSSMTLGGAEKVVHDQLRALDVRKASAKLFVANEASPAYRVDDIERCQVFRLSARPAAERMRLVGAETLATPTRAVFTHLIRAAALEPLAGMGVAAIPVVHNSEQGWQDAPRAYDRPFIPFVVACAEEVKRQLVALGCPRPVVVLRHEVPARRDLDELRRERVEIRRRHGIADDVVLIGMVGQFKAQKAYTRAVRVLAALRRDLNCRLMILGGWDHEWGQGRAAYAAACRAAVELDVMADLITPGPITNVAPYYAAFDVLLNTSVFEGLSIAVLEAIAAGCPVVAADAGGNREALGRDDVLVTSPDDIEAYARGVVAVLRGRTRQVPPPPEEPDLVARLWGLLGRYGLPAGRARRPGARVLVVTEQLDDGGARRALVDLLTHLPDPARAQVIVLSPSSSERPLRRLEAAGVPVLSLHGAGRMDQVERILALAERIDAGAICFWGAPAPIKLAVAKVLEASDLRLVDVGAAAALTSELDAAADVARRVCLGGDAYLRRLDAQVATHAGALAPAPVRGVVIPGGVATPGRVAPARLEGLGWDAFDPRLAIGAVAEVSPGQRLDLLLDAMDLLADRLPGATLTVVGGYAPRHAASWRHLARKIENGRIRNVAFVGEPPEVAPYLAAFQLFALPTDPAEDGGAEVACLEAMAAGVPVIATRGTAAARRVVDGATGYLVGPDDPVELAARIEQLLRDRRLRRRMSAGSRRRARQHYSMKAMVDAYGRIFDGKR